MIAYTLGVFLLGVLLGSVLGGAYTLKEEQRRYRRAYERLKALHDRSDRERA